MNKKILELIREVREPLVLVTIIDTKGSAPRHTGSKMLVSAVGIIEGTVGGGRGEYNGIQEARQVLKHRGFTIMDVARLGDDPRESLMICGGAGRKSSAISRQISTAMKAWSWNRWWTGSRRPSRFLWLLTRSAMWR